MIIWNSSSFPALYSSCSELNHKKIQYCSSSGLSRLCSSFLDLSNFLISGKSSNEKKPETRNSWNEEFPETRKILKRGISWNEEILSHHRLLCFITNIKRNTAGLSANEVGVFYPSLHPWFDTNVWSFATRKWKEILRKEKSWTWSGVGRLGTGQKNYNLQPFCFSSVLSPPNEDFFGKQQIYSLQQFVSLSVAVS